MSSFRLFCFKQYFKIHLFCLLMMVVFRLFMHVQLGITLWLALIVSTVASSCYLFLKPFMITRDTYTIMALTSCFSLSIIALRFLWIALAIDLINMLYFVIAMVIFALIISFSIKFKGLRKKKKKLTQQALIKYGRIVGWGFLGFLFFYQLVLSYLLRPNFLTVMALSVSHLNLLLIIWTYFDLGRLYSSKSRKNVIN